MSYQVSPYLYQKKNSADEAIGVKKGEINVVLQPPFYQYNWGLPLVVSVCIVQIRTRPTRRPLDEVIRPSSC